jgi:hypothetical protein
MVLVNCMTQHASKMHVYPGMGIHAIPFTMLPAASLSCPVNNTHLAMPDNAIKWACQVPLHPWVASSTLQLLPCSQMRSHSGRPTLRARRSPKG